MPDPNPSERLAEIEARVEAATAGPWRWYGNTKSQDIMLVGSYPPIPFVMGLARWGMRGAKLLFQRDGVMQEPAARYEVLGDQTIAEAGKEPYRYDITSLDHPDAEFLAHAREDIPWLLEREKKLREALDASERDARWIVGQWQRLKDEPLKAVALSIVDRCRAALADSGEASGEASQ